ncbi:MAG: 4-hydroxy-tetrahydrodipicolinate reductase, partial [Vampirovibrionia bacterium]
GLIAPNFAIGAVLMMEFSQRAAKYFDNVEIIELHHNKKLDAPSGTAIKTAELIEQSQEKFGSTNVDDKELMKGARGAVSEKNIHIHSVRLPGLVAHQEVYLAGASQMLTIRHDSFDRKSFMPGVVLSIRNVMSQNTLIYGLENIL